MKRTGPAFRSRRGFTLVEMLVVIAVVGLLLTLATYTTVGSLGSASLSTSAEALAADLDRCRQEAVTRNRTVEIRFHAWDGAIRAYELLVATEDGVPAPLEPMRRFGSGVVVSEDPTLTQLGPTGALPAAMLPGDLPAGTTTRSFRYRVDGSTDLDRSARWFATLVLDTRPGTPPEDFATVQIEPLTGAVKAYRP